MGKLGGRPGPPTLFYALSPPPFKFQNSNFASNFIMHLRYQAILSGFLIFDLLIAGVLELFLARRGERGWLTQFAVFLHLRPLLSVKIGQIIARVSLSNMKYFFGGY